MISQLADCSSIDDYHVTKLITEVAPSPRNRRGPAYASRRDVGTGRQRACLRPSPATVAPHSPFADHPQYGGLLRKVHQWMAGGLQSWTRQHAGSELFALIAGSFEQETLSVLREALKSGNAERVSAVGSILRNAPRALLWDQVDFVSLALRCAQQHGQDSVQAVAGGLHALAFNGMRRGTQASHSPRMSSSERDQLKSLLDCQVNQ